MMNKPFVIILILLQILFAGCSAAIRGYPEPPRVSTAQHPDPDYLLGRDALNKYHNETDPVNKKILRNEIIDARMEEIDKKFGEFEMALHKQGVGYGIGTDWILLAIAGATATIGSKGTKAALGAVTTGIVGAKASFDKNALFDKALPSIITQMVAQRETMRAVIRKSQEYPVETYSIYSALSDLRRFNRAGSIPGAIQSISEDAGQKATTARQELKDIRIAKYVKSTTGDLLRKFWKPDGNKINTTNEQNLKAWMQKNGIATTPGSITMFLRSDILEKPRIQAVKELGLITN